MQIKSVDILLLCHLSRAREDDIGQHLGFHAGLAGYRTDTVISNEDVASMELISSRSSTLGSLQDFHTSFYSKPLDDTIFFEALVWYLALTAENV